MLPSPHGLSYDQESGLLSWKPPSLQDFNADLNLTTSTDSMIMNYGIHVTNQVTGVTKNFTSVSTEFEISKWNLPCNVYVQVSAVNPAGESQRSDSLSVDCKRISVL